MKKDILLLGYGSLSKALKKYLEKNNYTVYSSSRKNKELIYFDLEDENSYKNIDNNYNIIWTFPAIPSDKVKQLFYSLKKSKIIIIFGTTSSYIQNSYEITENSELDIHKERVKGEQFLYNNHANLVNLSGIYSYESSPYTWLNKGLVKNLNKLINLIHINDICKFTYLLIEKNIEKEIFNLSDGKAYLWKDILENGLKNGYIDNNIKYPNYLEFEGKKISNNKVLEFFPNFKFEYFI